jgi:ribonuclease HI
MSGQSDMSDYKKGFDPRAVKIYVDGSARPTNPGRAGFAAWIEYPDDFEKDLHEITLRAQSFERSTNQRMELMACISAHEFIASNRAEWGVERVQIITDSKYVFDNQNRPEMWRSRGWRSADGKPIENVDLWKDFCGYAEIPGFA